MQWNRNSVRDPVCGMYLDPARAITRTVQGRIFYFCEKKCAETFLEQASPSSENGLKKVSSPADSIRKTRPAREIRAGGIREGRTS